MVYNIPEAELVLGEREYLEAMAQWVEARDNKSYPGLCTEEVDFVRPGWAVPEEDLTLTSGGVSI
jgi:hypothetical protein